MNGWIYVIISVLVIIIISMGLKIYFLKKSAREIKRAFAEKIEHSTNTLIHISSHDADMKDLASSLNEQLKPFHLSRKKYEHGDLELKEAITNISHDLRTPLTAVYGYLKLLENEECSETGRHYLLAMENRIRALKQLTEELLHYTIAVADTEDMVLERVNLNGILESSISAFYSVLKQNNITPQISMPEKVIMRTGNEDALSRILGNIINNAVKYSEGDLKITLTENGEIFCSNHASGLTKVQTERLFDRFYTVNNARKSTGLGLSIAKALTEKMGGTISAAYREGTLTICIAVPEK